MRSSHQATGQHQARILRDARVIYREWRGEAAEAERAEAIAALPSVTFKGRALKVLRCHGVRGKGPHDCNVPESLLWILMDLSHFCCVFHHGDQGLTKAPLLHLEPQ
jgi:hypothetical protein